MSQDGNTLPVGQLLSVIKSVASEAGGKGFVLEIYDPPKNGVEAIFYFAAGNLIKDERVLEQEIMALTPRIETQFRHDVISGTIRPPLTAAE